MYVRQTIKALPSHAPPSQYYSGQPHGEHRREANLVHGARVTLVLVAGVVVAVAEEDFHVDGCPPHGHGHRLQLTSALFFMGVVRASAAAEDGLCWIRLCGSTVRLRQFDHGLGRLKPMNFPHPIHSLNPHSPLLILP